MITDAKLGLKVAETPEEALWFNVKNNTENKIKELEETLKGIPFTIMVQKEILKLAKTKLKKYKP